MSKTEKLTFLSLSNLTLIGLVSLDPIYRLSHFINNALQINLKESKSMKFYHQKRKIYQEFIVFNYFSEDTETTFSLIQNKGEQGLLIEEQKQVDFWLKYENSDKTASEIISRLKSIKEISLSFEVNLDKLKSKKRI